MKISVFLLFVLLLLMGGCDDYSYPTDGNNPPLPQGPYPIETEVSLTPDREYIYYISTDTVVSGKNGIYRARVSIPVREPVLLGDSLHSPVVSLNSSTLAYIDSGRVHYYNLVDKVIQPSALIDSFESVIFVNDTLLVAARDRWLYLINEKQQTSTFFAYGWDPTFVARDTFVYWKGFDSTYIIIRTDIDKSYPQTLYNLKTGATPRWPTFDKGLNRIAYGVEWHLEKHVYAVQVNDSAHFIADVEYSKPYLIDYNRVIYTGPDGRFYQSDFYGEKSFPFIYIKR